MNTVKRAFSLRRNFHDLLFPASDRFRAVDGLRALSVLWLILLHSLYFLGEFLPREAIEPLLEIGWVSLFAKGHFGVDVFFVISGFLIASLLFRERQRTGRIALGRFYARRFWRLFPAYAVALVLCALLIKLNRTQAWANVLNVNNFIPFSRQFMGWAWSLAVEWQFYLIFPFFLIWCRAPEKNGLAWLFLLLALNLAAHAAATFASGVSPPIPFHPHFDPETFGRFFDWTYDKPYNRFGALICGALVAYLLAYRPGWAGTFGASRLRPIALIASVSVVVALLLIRDTHLQDPPWSRFRGGLYLTFYRYLFSSAMSLLLLTALTGPRKALVHRLLSFKAWYPVAHISYSAYLLHPIVILAVYFLWLDRGADLHHSYIKLLPAIFSLTFASSLLLHFAVEKPFLNLRDK